MLSAAAQDDALIQDFISTQVFPGIPPHDLWRALNTDHVPEWSIAAVPPLSHPTGAVGVRLTHIFRQAAETALGQHLSSLGAKAAWLNDEITRDPAALQAIITRMVQSGDMSGALAVFDQGGGWNLFYRIGPHAFAELVALFPEDTEEIDLVLARGLLALKDGEVQHALALLIERFGQGIADTLSVVRSGGEYPLKVASFAFCC